MALETRAKFERANPYVPRSHLLHGVFLKQIYQTFNGGFKPPQNRLISIITIRPMMLRNLARWS